MVDGYAGLLAGLGRHVLAKCPHLALQVGRARGAALGRLLAGADHESREKSAGLWRSQGSTLATVHIGPTAAEHSNDS